MNLRRAFFIATFCLNTLNAQYTPPKIQITSSDSTSVTLIKDVIQNLRNLGIDDGSVVIDNYSAMKRFSAFMSLSDFMKSNYNAVIDDVMMTDPDPIGIAVLLVSAHALNAESYRGFLDRMVELAEAGRINKREIKWAIFPPSPNLAKVWIETYNDAQTRESVERVKKIFFDESNMIIFCDSLLSGQLQQEAIATEKAMNHMAKSRNKTSTAKAVNESPPKQTGDRNITDIELTKNFPLGSKKTMLGVVFISIVLTLSLLLWLTLKRRL